MMTPWTISTLKKILICNFLSLAFLFLHAQQAQSDQGGKSPVKVFILAGQSNMQGQGLVKHLQYLIDDPETAKSFKHLQNGKGEWIVRDDVWIWCIGRKAKGGLSVGFGANKDRVGPELGFGTVVGDKIKNQVLLIKTSWGGRNLIKDYLPPSSGGPGFAYKELVQIVHKVLDSIKTEFPEYDGKGYEIAGFVWFQGWNDYVDGKQRKEKYETYTKNLANLIRDLRKEFKAPKMPVVIGELGTGGPKNRGDFQKAQEAAAKLPEFKGTVTFVKTGEYYDMKAHEMYEKNVWKGPEKEKFYRIASDRPYHYLGSGKTYYLMGAAFGRAMMDLLEPKRKQ